MYLSYLKIMNRSYKVCKCYEKNPHSKAEKKITVTIVAKEFFPRKDLDLNMTKVLADFSNPMGSVP